MSPSMCAFKCAMFIQFDLLKALTGAQGDLTGTRNHLCLYRRQITSPCQLFLFLCNKLFHHSMHFLKMMCEEETPPAAQLTLYWLSLGDGLTLARWNILAYHQKLQ